MAPIRISSFFSTKPFKPIPPPPIITYYIASAPCSSSKPFQPLLHPISPNEPGPSTNPIPTSSLIFAFIHPPLQSSEPASFFLRVFPDPIGFAYHAANFAAAELRLEEDESWKWRHQLIEIELENKDGLAATSGGHIGISLNWVADVMKQVSNGERDELSAAKEFKGVLLHELVHTIQYDGNGSSPSWLTESIADYVRLAANLGPPHWRQPGQGRRDKGWEDAYDAGAQFLSWLTGGSTSTSELSPTSSSGLLNMPTSPTKAQYAPSASGTQPASPSMYPINTPPPIPPRPEGNKGQPRRGPFSDLVKLINVRLMNEQWNDAWWEEMAGARLEVLWKEYLDYYA